MEATGRTASGSSSSPSAANMLVEMGFEAKTVAKVLEVVNNDQEKALQCLLRLQQEDFGSFSSPSCSASEEKLMQDVRKALSEKTITLPTLQRKLSNEAEELPIETKKQMLMVWSCGSCTFENQIFDTACSICRSERPALSEKQREEMGRVKWTCPKCTFLNDRLEAACVVCGEAKPRSKEEKESLKREAAEAEKNRKKTRNEGVRCGACFATVPRNDLVPASCSHSFCKNCWTRHVVSAIESGQADNVRCMDPMCSCILKKNEVMEFLPKERRARYLRFLRAKDCNQSPNKIWCPTKGCDGVLEIDSKHLHLLRRGASPPKTTSSSSSSSSAGGFSLFSSASPYANKANKSMPTPESKAPRVACSECTIAYCFFCKIEWHEGFSCSKYKQMRLDDAKARLRATASPSKWGWGRQSKMPALSEKEIQNIICAATGCDVGIAITALRLYSSDPVKAVDAISNQFDAIKLVSVTGCTLTEAETSLDACNSDVDQAHRFLGTQSVELNVLKSLKKHQLAAIKHVAREAKRQSEEAIEALTKRWDSEGLSKICSLDRVLEYIRDEAQLIVHVNLPKTLKFLVDDTHYRNQFETKTSGGLRNLKTRTQWEDRLFNRHYHSSPAFERVKYGVCNIVHDPEGIKSCKAYGQSYLILKKVRLRTTFSDKDSGNSSCVLATCQHYAHVLLTYDKQELQAVAEVASGLKKWGCASDCIRRYKEVQIHGPLSLGEHVDCLCAHPNEVNAEVRELMKRFSMKHKVNVIEIEKRGRSSNERTSATARRRRGRR